MRTGGVRPPRLNPTHPEADSLPLLHELAGLFVPRRGLTVGAGGHAGERDQLPPLERRPARSEFVGGRGVILLGVESTILADRVVAEECEYVFCGVGLLGADSLSECRGPRLI